MTMHGGDYRSTLFTRPVVYRFFGVLHTADYFCFLSAKKGPTDDMLVCSATPSSLLFVGIRCFERKSKEYGQARRQGSFQVSQKPPFSANCGDSCRRREPDRFSFVTPMRTTITPRGGRRDSKRVRAI